jgi:hypothetical protein
LRPLADEVRKVIDRVATEIPRVAFEIPEGFEALRFHPLGIDSRPSWPFPDLERPLAVVAPFLTGGLLRRLQERFTIEALVSIPESLAAVAPEVLERCKCYVLTDGADLESRVADEPEGGESGESQGASPVDDDFSGLHAKLFVMDDGAMARVWTGSANATDAAFDRNVELLVELTGKKAVCGIEAFLGSESSTGSFLSLLQPYEPGEQEPPDPEQEELERSLERARLTLAQAGFRFRVEQEGEDEMALVLTCASDLGGALPPGLQVVAWPATLHQDSALPPPLTEGASVRFEPLSMEALTSFCAFRVAFGEASGMERFLLNLPLDDVPAERDQRLLSLLLDNRKDVIRLLLLLLVEEGFDVHGLVGEGGDDTYDFFRRRVGLDGSGLLEALLEALVKAPERLDEVERVIRGLAATEEGRKLLPEELHEIWEPIWAVRQESR